jgi:hypothetical protein
MKDQTASGFPADIPLPSKIFGKYEGWGSRAQQYPIFSQTWYKYRLLSYILPMVLLGMAISLSFFVFSDSNAKYKLLLASIFSWVSIATALVLGRGLAVAVVKRNWSERKTSIGVLLAISVGLLVTVYVMDLEHGYESQFKHDYIQELKQKKQTDLVIVDANDNAEYQNSPAIATVKYLLLSLLFLWLAGSLDLIAYFRQRRAMKDMMIDQRVALYQKERNEAELRLSVLASQIEPHFLFNTLSGVRSAILSDPQMGVAIIDNLVEYLRATIPELRSDGSCSQVKLGSQMLAIRAYLGVIKFRIPRLSFEVEFDPALSELFIPPLMLISLVENAVKHGIELKKGPVHIDVKAEVDDQEKLVLTVRDNGLGFTNVTSGTGIGLTNIRERLKQLYKDHAALTLETNDESGVTARIILPVDTFE